MQDQLILLMSIHSNSNRMAKVNSIKKNYPGIKFYRVVLILNAVKEPKSQKREKSSKIIPFSPTPSSGLSKLLQVFCHYFANY